MLIRSIFLLDDDPDEKYILQDAFDGLGVGVEIRQFLTFRHLLEHFDTLSTLPDLLLLDVNLPAETGIECIRVLKSQERFTNLHIVMYTNAADEMTIAQSFEYGASAYMKKTNTLGILQDNLKKLLEWNLQVIFHLPIEERTLLN